ncbi:hypothetical protein AB0I39_08010 [Kitasatospora purpeofusca]|uniref:hypothetical protein n=1 Tax=Kitasatospora purpeofusca TaxID=67352 RepID=UPI0033E44232
MPVPPSLTRLDSRVEAALGAGIAVLHAAPARPDAAEARVLDAHRALTKAETAVAFERVRLLICADRQRRVDDRLLADLGVQLEVLEDAAAARDQAEADLLEHLQALQSRDAPRSPGAPGRSR